MTYRDIQRPDKWSKQSLMRYMADLAQCPDVPAPFDVLDPTPYSATGSTYGADAVRISGSPEFVDAVLARLSDLLCGENQWTRLAASRATVKDTEINGERKCYQFAGREVCYLQVHYRNPEGIGHDALPGATQRFESTRPHVQAAIERGKRFWRAFLGDPEIPEAERTAAFDAVARRAGL